MKSEESIISQLSSKQMDKLKGMISKLQQEERIKKNLSGPDGPVHDNKFPKEGSPLKHRSVLTKAQIKYWKDSEKERLI